jgi:glycosyltransferase involved in cell wall biosynthesis
MRILQIAPPWFPVPPAGYGGTEQIVSLLADGLTRRGHDVTLVAAGGSTTLARLIATCARAPSSQLGNASIELAHALAGYHDRDAYDVIHDHTLLGIAAGSVPCGPPVVHTVHGAWTPDAVRLYVQVGGRVHLIAISNDQAQRAPSGVAVGSVVHNGVDVASHPFTRAPGDYLGYVGRANAQKGPRQAIEVARRLGMRLRMAVKVNEPYEHDYYAAHIAPAASRGEVEIVQITSHEEKCALLGGARVVLFPIAWPEPFGLVPVEANACGTPVVAFAEGAMPEVVAHGVSGMLVPGGDLDGFTAAVATAARLDRAACRRSVLQRFDAARMVTAYERVYRQVLERSASATPASLLDHA